MALAISANLVRSCHRRNKGRPTRWLHKSFAMEFLLTRGPRSWSIDPWHRAGKSLWISATIFSWVGRGVFPQRCVSLANLREAVTLQRGCGYRLSSLHADCNLDVGRPLSHHVASEVRGRLRDWRRGSRNRFGPEVVRLSRI